MMIHSMIRRRRRMTNRAVRPAMAEAQKRPLILAAALGGFWAGRRIRSRRSYRLQGKVVLITGGSRGLGLALAREAASQGARVAICGRDPASLDRARGSLARTAA